MATDKDCAATTANRNMTMKTGPVETSAKRNKLKIDHVNGQSILSNKDVIDVPINERNGYNTHK